MGGDHRGSQALPPTRMSGFRGLWSDGAMADTVSSMSRVARVVAVLAACVVVAACSGSKPDPAELAGTDGDGDGVRDDVAAAIDRFDPALRDHLIEVAANEQQVVTFDPGAPGASERAWGLAQEANRLASCPPEGVELAVAIDAAEEVRSLVANTDARRDAQRAFTAAISGRSFPAPDCDAAPSPASPAP